MTKIMADSPKKNGRIRTLPENLAVDELSSVPLLGPARIQALTAAGLRTLADLRSISEDELGSVKGIGTQNARKIKAWLDEHMRGAGSEVSGELREKDQITEANRRLQKAIAELDQAVFQIKALLPGRTLDKKLISQLDKLNSAATDLPECTLAPNQKWEKALRRLKKVTAIVCVAASHNLSDKAKQGLRQDIRKRRRRLTKALDSQQ